MRIMDGYRTLGRLALVGALVGAELYLARDLTATGGVVGYTMTHSNAIAPQRRAKIRTVAVQLGATVTAGQVIAELDTTDVDNEIEAAAAQRQQAIAAIEAGITQQRRDTENTVRRFESGEERAVADLASAEAGAHTAGAELAAVQTEIARQADLVERRLASSTVLAALELRRATLAKQVHTADKVLAVLSDNARAAQTRKTGLATTGEADAVLAPLESQLRSAELRLDQLARERTALTLRAPLDGVVEQLALRPGDLASPDAPVAVVVSSDTRTVVACVPELRASSVAIGTEADTTSAFDHLRATGAVESLTTEITALPARCQPPGHQLPVMGRLAIVALDTPTSSLPGQTQIVHFQARRRAARRAPPARDTSTTPTTPARMHVPGSVLARSRFEPSGLAWVAALERYVIVSDDTGFKGRDDRAPWLFTMTADGHVDPDPLVVRGVKELDDLESIAVDASGALWLLSSQSMSHKGKRPSARRQLVRVEIEGGIARATGVVELADLLDRATAEERRALGFADTRALDIEALAARGGELYLGLKAPVDGSERAQIWKIGQPERLLAGDLHGAKLTLWSKLSLAVDADGHSVPGGISDMMFLGADRLVITATASGVDPRTQTSALYVAEVAAGEMTPRRVRGFVGLKAEGVALAPGGDRLAVVFDRGSEPAMWLELPLAELAAQDAGHAR